MPKHEFSSVEALVKALEQYEAEVSTSMVAAMNPQATVLSSAVIALASEVARLRREIDGMKSRTAF